MPVTLAPAPTSTTVSKERPDELALRAAREQYRYIQDSMLFAGLGVAGYAVGPALGAGQLASWAIAGGFVAFSATTFVTGRRKSLRDQVTARCAASLEPVLGKGLISVKLGKWDSTWGTVPGQVIVRYHPGQPDGDPKWIAAITDALAARTGMPFTVKSLNRKNCRLDLERDTSTKAEESAQLKRVQALIGDLIPTSTITNIDLDDAGEITRIEVSHHAAHKLAARGYQNRITRTISASLPGRWRAQWDTTSDTVTFSIRPEFPASLWVSPVAIDQTRDPLKTYREVRIPYAVDEDGNIVSWRPAVDPHFLCVGATGTGKTSTEHTILVQISRYGWPIWVADAKSIEFLGFRAWPNVQVVATNTVQQMAVIHRAWQVMERRYELITAGFAREEDFEPLMVFVDEWADMRAAITLEYNQLKEKGMPAKCPIFDEYESIARKGRTSRVHMLVSLQRPDVNIFGSGESRDNFRCRVSMGKLSPQGAQMMWQDMSVGISIPAGKSGRGTTVTEDNRVVEVQCFRTPDPRKAANNPEELALLTALAPATALHQRLQILPPVLDDLDCEEGEEPKPPSYTDFVEAEWAIDPNPFTWEDVAVEFDEQQAAEARRLSSPTTILGVGMDPNRPHGSHRNGPVTIRYATNDTPPNSVETDTGSIPGDDFTDGYGPQLVVPVTQVEIGDLLLIDEDTDHWGVIDEDPADDMDDDCLTLCWRDDEDDEGVLSVPINQHVTIRRIPEEI